MLLRLIMLRHGEAETGLGIPDAVRQLTARGQRYARKVGMELANLGWLPEVGGVSDATRTLETQLQIGEAFSDIVWIRSPKLYLASPDLIVQELIRIAASTQSLIVVGHNPGLSDLGATLVGEPVRLEPADAALLSIDALTWRDAFAMTGCWRLDGIVRPSLGLA